MSGTTTIPPDIAALVGPMFLSYVLHWGLFGALSVQAYIYYLAFPSDTRFTKAIVSVVYTIEFFQTILATREGFRTFGFGWGDLNILDDPGLTWLCFPVITSIVSCIIQFYYAWRIWVLSRSKYVPLMICGLSLVQAAGGIWVGIVQNNLKSFARLQAGSQVPTTIWLAGTATCDILITLSMFQYLFTNRSGFASTDAILVKLIRLILETGLLTSTVAVVDVIIFSLFKDDNYHLVPARILSKLYSNSMMVLLNARFGLRNGRNGECHEVEPANNLSWAVGPNPNPQSQRTPTTYRLADFSTSGGSTTSPVPISEGRTTKADETQL